MILLSVLPPPTHTHTWMRARTHTHTHMDACTHTCTHTHAHAHTHMHTCAHTLIATGSFQCGRQLAAGEGLRHVSHPGQVWLL